MATCACYNLFLGILLRSARVLRSASQPLIFQGSGKLGSRRLTDSQVGGLETAEAGGAPGDFLTRLMTSRAQYNFLLGAPLRSTDVLRCVLRAYNFGAGLKLVPRRPLDTQVGELEDTARGRGARVILLPSP